MIRSKTKTLFAAREFKDILARNKVRQISLFGSQLVDGVPSPSDYDFLVQFEEDADLLDHVGLKQDLEEYLKKKVDVVTRNSLSRYLRDNVLKEAVSLDV